MSSSSSVAVIAMGGTIDKDYIVDSASLEVVDPFIRWIELELGMTHRLEVTHLTQKDSLDLADYDRARLVAYLATNNQSRILITHGTDTLLATASAVWEAQKDG